MDEGGWMRVDVDMDVDVGGCGWMDGWMDHG